MKWLSLRTRVIRGDSLRKELRVVDRTVRCLAVTQKQAYALGVRIPRYPPNIGNASPCGVSTKNSTNLITKEISMIYWYKYIYMFDLDEGEDMPFWCIIAQILA